jgi:hypothetical protein
VLLGEYQYFKNIIVFVSVIVALIVSLSTTEEVILSVIVITGAAEALR